MTLAWPSVTFCRTHGTMTYRLCPEALSVGQTQPDDIDVYVVLKRLQPDIQYDDTDVFFKHFHSDT